MFFIGLLVFALNGLENPQIAFFQKKADFFKKSNFEDFWGISSLFREKTKSSMKKIYPGQEMLKIIQTIHFLRLEVDK